MPYVTHVLGVASLVMEHGGDEDAAIAALLHDTAGEMLFDARFFRRETVADRETARPLSARA